MPKLDGLAVVLRALKKIPPKQAAQVAKKVFSLALDPNPQDCRPMKGYDQLLRVDSGEFRIIYFFHEEEEVVKIIAVGKRNDDEVYKEVIRRLQ